MKAIKIILKINDKDNSKDSYMINCNEAMFWDSKKLDAVNIYQSLASDDFK